MSKVNRIAFRTGLCLLASTASLMGASLLGVNAWAKGPDAVTITNSAPIPVTGTVNAVVSSSAPLPVTGNVTITNPGLPVSGTVSVSGTTLVAPAVPTNPGFWSVHLRDGASPVSSEALGSVTGTTAISTLILTNVDPTNVNYIRLYQPVYDASTTGCPGNPPGGYQLSFNVILEPNKTVSIQFPTPLVLTTNPANFPGLIVPACLMIDGAVTGTVEVDAIGYYTN